MQNSRDAIQWNEHGLGSSKVIFGEKRFISVAPGVIAVSEEVEFQPLISNSRLEAPGILEFETDAPEGTVWEVQTSGDLLEWSPAGLIEGNSAGRQTFGAEFATESPGFLRMQRVSE